MPDNAFSFRLIVGTDAASFQDVSGLGPEIEDFLEGGESRFHHRLPKTPKHQNLRLKRGIMKDFGELVTWCKNVLEGDLSKPTETKTVIVEMVAPDDDQKPLRIWTFYNAYPVKWDVEPFNAKSNEVAIGTLELSYKTFEQK